MKSTIVCVGNLVHDEVFWVEALPARGIKTGVLDHSERYGGPAATAAVAISHLGGGASYLGRGGADPAGETALRTLRKHRGDFSGIAGVTAGGALRGVLLVGPAGGSHHLSHPAR